MEQHYHNNVHENNHHIPYHNYHIPLENPVKQNYLMIGSVVVIGIIAFVALILAAVSISGHGHVRENSIKPSSLKKEDAEFQDLISRNLTLSGDLSVDGTLGVSGKMGYQKGGLVVQEGVKGDTVTANFLTGKIKTMDTLLHGRGYVSFIVNNNKVTKDDIVLVSHCAEGSSQTDAYDCIATYVDNGSFRIAIHNNSGSDLENFIRINFIVIKGATK